MKNLLIILLLSTNFIYSQSEIGIIKLVDGEEFVMYDGSNAEKKEKLIHGVSVSSFGNYAFNSVNIYFFAKNGEINDVKVKKINKVLITDSYTFLPLEIRRNQLRLMKLVAENDKYILSEFESNSLRYFYIYDLDYNSIEKQIIYMASKKKSLKAIETIKQYFANCEELISGLELNFSKPYGEGLRARYFLLFHIEDREFVNNIFSIDCSSD